MRAALVAAGVLALAGAAVYVVDVTGGSAALSGFRTVSGAAESLRPGAAALTPAAVHSVEVTTRTGGFTLARGAGGTWRVASRDGFPADSAAVERLIARVAGARVVAETREPPASLALYGLQPVDEPSSKARRLIFRDAAGETLLAMRVGFAMDLPGDPPGHQTMAALTEQGRVVLLEGVFDPNTALDAWLGAPPLDLRADELVGIRIRPAPDGPAYRFARAADTDWRRVTPEGERLAVGKTKPLHGIAHELAAFEFVDVRRGDAAARETLPAPYALDVETADGLRLGLDLHVGDAAAWLAVREVAAACAAGCPAAERAARLRRATDGWLYKLPVSGAAMLAVEPDRILD